MSALTLKCKVEPSSAVDVSSLKPSALAGKSRREIARLPLPGWNQTFEVGELFSLRGDDLNRVVIDGANGRFIRAGAGLDGGELTIAGEAGDYVGEAMRGGSITVRGNAGAFLGAGMAAGQIEVSGNTGGFAGSGRAGELHGMRGGTIVIRGNAGDRAGDRMRRGSLLIEGDAGDYCASRMLAGTIVVLGHVGTLPGYLMRRGTLLLDRPGSALPPTFNLGGRQDLLAIRLLLESFSVHGRRFREFGRSGPFSRWLGDLGCDGKGEILIARE